MFPTLRASQTSPYSIPPVSSRLRVLLPDDLAPAGITRVFRQAEATARRLRVSSDQLYATALAEFLRRQQSENISARLNEGYSREHSELDPALQQAQLESIGTDAW